MLQFPTQSTARLSIWLRGSRFPRSGSWRRPWPNNFPAGPVWSKWPNAAVANVSWPRWTRFRQQNPPRKTGSSYLAKAHWSRAGSRLADIRPQTVSSRGAASGFFPRARGRTEPAGSASFRRWCQRRSRDGSPSPGEENGDLEAWILFGWGPPDDPQRYTVQGYYTNERGNTVGAWRD